jgi:acetyl-CoA carboxylase biotin carboxyl carrier protein
MAKINVESEVTGTVWKVEMSVGNQVSAGDTIMILESMKMEIPVEAPEAGRISHISVAVEESVEEGQVLCVIEN